jgi:Flp pilus assembly protein TadG
MIDFMITTPDPFPPRGAASPTGEVSGGRRLGDARPDNAAISHAAVFDRPAFRTSVTGVLRATRDRRGVAAMEAGIVLTLLVGLMLPITDFAVAATQYIGAYQALRDLGAYALVHPPKDVTSPATWTASLPVISGYRIAAYLLCGTGDTTCSAANQASPKVIKLTTTITVSPMFVSGLAGSYTVTYAERFQ